MPFVQSNLPYDQTQPDLLQSALTSDQASIAMRGKYVLGIFCRFSQLLNESWFSHQRQEEIFMIRPRSPIHMHQRTLPLISRADGPNNLELSATEQLLQFGSSGLRSVGRGQINSRQFATLVRVMAHQVGRRARIWIRHASCTTGSADATTDSSLRVQAGKMLYEIEGISDQTARSALRLVAAKLPFRTRIVSRGYA